jgi:hypothetical protein
MRSVGKRALAESGKDNVNEDDEGIDARKYSRVIPGWSEGPDLRCAIAHRGISRFRVRVFNAPRNDGSTIVMAGLDPAIHVFLSRAHKNVDARDKPGHDAVFVAISVEKP